MTGNGSANHFSAEVLQASGMVAVQVNCTPTEALALMQERADAKHCCTLSEYANAIVERRTRFI